MHRRLGCARIPSPPRRACRGSSSRKVSCVKSSRPGSVERKFAAVLAAPVFLAVAHVLCGPRRNDRRDDGPGDARSRTGTNCHARRRQSADRRRFVVQAGGIMVITGKGYGVTNLIALDPNGGKIYEKLVRVQGPAEDVVVYRGKPGNPISASPIANGGSRSAIRRTTSNQPQPDCGSQWPRDVGAGAAGRCALTGSEAHPNETLPARLGIEARRQPFR